MVTVHASHCLVSPTSLPVPSHPPGSQPDACRKSVDVRNALLLRHGLDAERGLVAMPRFGGDVEPLYVYRYGQAAGPGCAWTEL